MPSGGPRVGRPGVAYPNRTDLNSGDRQYGDGVNKQAVRQATPGTPTGGPLPGQLSPLNAPTDRPGEPVTAGLPMGPGAGPDALTPVPTGNDALYELRALAARFPDRDLMRLIALAEESL